jgi:diguanylate cyclase (GGDEF)-like protein
MLLEKERDLVERLCKILLDVITLSDPPQFPVDYSSVDKLKTLHSNLIFLRDFLFAASNGDLSTYVPLRGFIPGTLKTLQSNLRHLTWQTKMVAAGDFTQRTEFMGEFSQSFNAMVMQLDQTMKELVRKESELSKINEELLKEIAIRKQTEEALRESEEAFKLQAIIDSLSGLFNRRHFYELAEIEISKSLRYRRPLSAIMFDIDFFKRINDTFGHSAGDKVIATVANITKEALRTTDLSARYGGEEFIVFLPETSAPQAAGVAERLRKQIENTIFREGDSRIKVTVSLGVNDYLGETSSRTNKVILSEFISLADQAMYASKSNGRNQVTIFDPP